MLDARIASPCSESWDQMASVPGQSRERVRHCGACALNVFDTRDLTADELRTLLASAERTGQRLCGRLYRRADGTLLTKDCPTGVAALRRKAWLALSMVVTFVFVALGVKVRSTERSRGDTFTSWAERTISTKVVAVREELRTSVYLGGIINELWPVKPVVHTEMGKIVSKRSSSP